MAISDGAAFAADKVLIDTWWNVNYVIYIND